MNTTPPAQNLEPASSSASSQPDRVLIAEDDPIFRRVLENWLQKWNYDVVSLENGLDAWSVLQQKEAPQMVILDWMMPGLDGVELCRKIRSHKGGPYKYVLLLTARGRKEDVVAGLEAGADDYLTKPFDVNELRARVRAGKRILELQGALLRVQTELQFESVHDQLTGLWNRGAIMGLLQREAQRSVRIGQPVGVMMVDLDNFKQINDVYGHQTGDTVLREVARRMREAVRNYDHVGRYGGEEFLIIVAEDSSSDLVATAERMRLCVSSKPVETGAGPIPVTISIGLVAGYPTGGRFTGEELLRAADTALYRAKHKGRNRVERSVEMKPASPARASAAP